MRTLELFTRLLDSASRTREVAFGHDGSRTRGELLVEAQILARALPEPRDGSHVLLVFREDRYLFAASLLACWLRGHTAALPPNTRRETILAIKSRAEVVSTLHDTDAGLEFRAQQVLADAATSGGLANALPSGAVPSDAPERSHGSLGPSALSRSKTAAGHEDSTIARAPTDPLDALGRTLDEARFPTTLTTLFTSGSTGEMTPCPKTAAQLLGEAEMLRETFFADGDDRVVATVPPGHIYGLLYSVLAPLLGGGSFLRTTPFLPESVGAQVGAFGADTLVTVPAHLRTLITATAERFASLRQVLSSTAPLAEATARAFFEHTGRPIHEIFGSSETGGIAVRVHPGSDRLRPLRGVLVSSDEDQHLLVSSPYVGGPTQKPRKTADLVTIYNDGSFTHHGRSDGVVKIGGRRASLPAMQQWLLQRKGVRDAAIAAVPAATSRGHQLLAAAVVDDSVTGEALLEQMAARFERSTLPRTIRLVDALPREDNGKLQRARLLRMFNLDPSGAPLGWELGWGAWEVTTQDDEYQASARVHVPERYAWFDGHFVGYPVMAAAVQLQQLVVPALEKHRPEARSIRRITRMKFTGRIQPGDDLTVALRWTGGEATTRFDITKPSENCSSGIIESEVAR